MRSKYNIWQKVGMFFYTKKTITLIIWAAFIVFGSLSYSVWMRKEGFPSVNFPIAVVQVVSFDQTPEDVDKNFVLPLTEAIKKDQSLKSVTSSSTNLGSTIQILYEKGTDVASSLEKIKTETSGKLPENGQVVYVEVNASKLTQEGDDVLISVHGSGLTPEQLDMSAEKMVSILSQKLTLDKKVHTYKLIELVTDPANGKTTSAQVRFDRFFDKNSGAVEPSVIVGVAGSDGVDQLDLYDEILAVLETDEVKSIGADSSIAADYAEGIRDQISGLQKNLLEGLAVVLVVSFLLISLRGSLVTALAMTTTVILTIAVLKLIGYSINTITLFSLVLCLALIVDDTTIMVEAIDAGLKKSKNFKEVVLEALKKVARASSTGTLVTILAFSPMLFIGGVLGEFIRAIPITIIISLIISLIVSIVFIPTFMKFSFGRSKTHKTRTFKPIASIEEYISNGLARILKWSVGTKTRSISTKLHAVLISLMFIVGGGLIFKNVEFNIFPAPKDGSEILISAQIKNREIATIAQTEEYTSALLSKVKDLVGDDLKRISLTAGSAADRDGFNAYVTLSSIENRQRTSVQIADSLQTELETLVPEMRITVSSAGVGPPIGNFSVQIKGDDIEKSTLLATDVAKFLETETLKRIDGSEAKFLEVRTTPTNIVTRSEGDRIVNVSADFDGTDVSALVELAKKAVTQEFNSNRVERYGLSGDSLGFDLGQEEENQKSFESMGKAAGPLFVVMFIVMALLFKNILQPILILTALPFALFGVAGGLYLTDNPLSFFAMLGVFALVGISLNNTILLTDYANQAQKEGMNPVDAMSSAIKHRLRPLMTTSITSVLALLPLALNDPFWEGLAYTLVYGLISSTLLVVLVFPYFYLIEEVISTRISRAIKKITKR